MRIVIIIIYLFSMTACDTHRKMLIKQGKIPKDSKFLGGKDGGSYVQIQPLKDDLIQIIFYDHWQGNKVKSFDFKNECGQEVSVKAIFKDIIAFDNQKIIWKNNTPNKCLKSIE